MDQKNLWRSVQVNKVVRVLLLFMGVIFMQMLAFMICAIGYGVWKMTQGVNVVNITEGLSKWMTAERSDLLIWVSVVSSALCLIWCGTLYHNASWRQDSFSYKESFSIVHILQMIGVGVGGCIVLTVGLSILNTLFPAFFQRYQGIISGMSDTTSPVTMVYVLLLGPASEEVIFRGAMLDRLKVAFPFWTANLIQAFLFGLYHMNLIQGIYAFLFGVALGMILECTGSIFTVVLTHILFNGTSFVLTSLFSEIKGGKMILLIVVTVTALLGVIWSIREGVKQIKQK